VNGPYFTAKVRAGIRRMLNAPIAPGSAEELRDEGHAREWLRDHIDRWEAGIKTKVRRRGARERKAT